MFVHLSKHKQNTGSILVQTGSLNVGFGFLICRFSTHFKKNFQSSANYCGPSQFLTHVSVQLQFLFNTQGWWHIVEGGLFLLSWFGIHSHPQHDTIVFLLTSLLVNPKYLNRNLKVPVFAKTN